MCIEIAADEPGHGRLARPQKDAKKPGRMVYNENLVWMLTSDLRLLGAHESFLGAK